MSSWLTELEGRLARAVERTGLAVKVPGEGEARPDQRKAVLEAEVRGGYIRPFYQGPVQVLRPTGYKVNHRAHGLLEQKQADPGCSTRVPREFLRHRGEQIVSSRHPRSSTGFSVENQDSTQGRCLLGWVFCGRASLEDSIFNFNNGKATKDRPRQPDAKWSQRAWQTA